MIGQTIAALKLHFQCFRILCCNLALVHCHAVDICPHAIKTRSHYLSTFSPLSQITKALHPSAPVYPLCHVLPPVVPHPFKMLDNSVHCVSHLPVFPVFMMFSSSCESPVSRYLPSIGSSCVAAALVFEKSLSCLLVVIAFGSYWVYVNSGFL